MTILSRSVATLRFFGDDLEPHELTEKLGAQPDFAFRKGDVEIKPSGRERVHRKGSWRIDSVDREPGDLDAQVVELLSKLTNDLEVWQQLTSRFKSDIFFGFFMSEGNEGISISPKTAEMVGVRGLKLDFDIYGPTVED